MDIKVNIKEKNTIDFMTLQKMVLLYNSLEEGWEIKKNNDKYIFKKKHEGKKEIFLDSYLKHFVEENIDINKIINS
jgi:hypothetical protein